MLKGNVLNQSIESYKNVCHFIRTFCYLLRGFDILSAFDWLCLCAGDLMGLVSISP